MKKEMFCFIAAATLVAATNAQSNDQRDRRVGDPPNSVTVYNYIIGYQLASQAYQKLKQDGVGLSSEAYGKGIADGLAGDPPKFDRKTVIAAIQTIQAEQNSQKKAQGAINLAEGDAFLSANEKKEDVKLLPSGLQYIESQVGTGPTPTPTSIVVVHYRGTLLNGEEFDSSYNRGQPARFSPGGVIPGFREAILNMRVGSKWRVFIPSEMGYGEKGAGPKIGPNQTLIFDLELLGIDP